MIKRHYLFLFFVVILFSACHSKRKVVRDIAIDNTNLPPTIAEKYATIMGVRAEAIQNNKLYAFIDEWIGTPYKFGGLDKSGIDCSGLALLLEQQVYGITLPRVTSQQVAIIKRKYEEELQEGDLVFFDYDGKKFSHVGVYLQNGYYVHASTSKGVMIGKLHDTYIYKYFSRCGSVTKTDASSSGK